MPRGGARKPKPFCQDTADRICELVAEGKSIAECAQEKGIPSRTHIYAWLNESEDFKNKYARAREQRADTLAHEVIFIADTEDDPQRARNRMDARKWAAGKMAPKTYGDRTILQGTGDKEDAIHVEGSAVLESLISSLARLASRE